MKTRTMISLGALACIPCCIGPILAVLAAIAALGVASTLLIGVAGLVIAAAAIAAAVIVQRRARRASRETSSDGVDDPVPVELTPSRG
jgi:membrane protein implicated in regulation of membrane protease activity